jgi:hypothetical protein
MHPFPPSAELQFLIGLEVGQVCLDPWSTQFRFVDAGQITVEGPFEHVDVAGQSHLHQAKSEQDTGPVFLRDLIQQRITKLESDRFRLTISFSNGSMLRIASEEGPFENGHIDHPAGFVVF